MSGDSNEGNFVENDDYVVKDLDDVRKVDKVQVIHATIAKKVDVRRLNLWTEVEEKIAPISQAESCKNVDSMDKEMYLKKKSIPHCHFRTLSKS